MALHEVMTRSRTRMDVSSASTRMSVIPATIVSGTVASLVSVIEWSW